MSHNPVNSNPAGQELRSTDRAIYGMAITNINDIIYSYGGYYNNRIWDKEALWTLSSNIDPNQFIQVKTDPNVSPTVIYSQLLYPSTTVTNSTSFVYIFGGHHTTNITKLMLEAKVNGSEPLRYYKYNIINHQWMPLTSTLSKNSSSIPLERYWHTATLSTEGTQAYLLGGMNISRPQNDFWRYDFISNSWTSLPLPSFFSSRCGHTSNMLSNGLLIILGGYSCIGNYTTNPVLPKTLFTLDNSIIYNTIHQSWSNQTLNGDIIPSPRTYHSAVTVKGDKIVICGGQDGEAQPFQSYISAGEDASTMTAILDTQKWYWTAPLPSPYQPFPRSFASAVLVNETKVLVGFGINHHTIYDGLYIFDATKEMWLPNSNLLILSDQRFNISISFIVGMTLLGSFICIVTIIIIYFLVNRLKNKLSEVINKVKNDIWDRRIGEPIWAEISRFLFRILFLSLFIVILIVLALQVLYSPVIDQKYYSHNDVYTIDVPDIRFCFSGRTNSNNITKPYIQCTTDFGDSCSQYVIDISENVKIGLNYYDSILKCYLFRAPPSFQLGRTKDRTFSNGSYLKFFYYGDQLVSNSSQLHIVFYHKNHNPNLSVYNIKDPFGLPFSWYTNDENAQFQSSEAENLRTENAFDLDPNVGSTSSYALVEHEEIQSSSFWNYVGIDSSFWNYVGIDSIYKRTYEISSKAASESVSTLYSTMPQPLGSLLVFPESYSVTVLSEQRAFTLVSAMGIIGGIFGLIVGLQTFLFGYRPRSPWGLIHRWSVGQMRISLLQNLKSRFPPINNVPIVHPVHRRLTANSILLNNKSNGSKSMIIDNNKLISKEKAIQLSSYTVEAEETIQDRICLLEERLHIFELLFQAYYIDDEIFRSLDHALQLDFSSVNANQHKWLRFLEPK
ncbi:unnamed protein product [Cunninghamella blakesleeana]